MLTKHDQEKYIEILDLHAEVVTTTYCKTKGDADQIKYKKFTAVVRILKVIKVLIY